ncbi:protein LE25 [Pyrus ussuriensis x Pyrus communis]|uniref:Protein LE25 n=1 Tax=Pyrus ussuriensis x Pyrus communis TaxID=2448454 RepID=A0A5N5HX77_9ROSA|nr:protein LE25 [Pyrus ussuriensis x Pyrus communis]
MQSAKEKLSNMASAAKEHVDIYKAKAQEKVVKATAKTDEEREIASQIRRAKEAKAKMEFLEAKTKHSAEKSTASAENKSPTLHGQDDQPVVGVGDLAMAMAMITNPTMRLLCLKPRFRHTHLEVIAPTSFP